MKKGLAIASGITAAIGSSVLYLKKKDICRKCEIKKALIVIDKCFKFLV